MKRNLHVDQANPVAQEALALLVDPAHNKEKAEDANTISNCYNLSLLANKTKQNNTFVFSGLNQSYDQFPLIKP